MDKKAAARARFFARFKDDPEDFDDSGPLAFLGPEDCEEYRQEALTRGDLERARFWAKRARDAQEIIDRRTL